MWDETVRRRGFNYICPSMAIHPSVWRNFQQAVQWDCRFLIVMCSFVRVLLEIVPPECVWLTAGLLICWTLVDLVSMLMIQHKSGDVTLYRWFIMNKVKHSLRRYNKCQVQLPWQSYRLNNSSLSTTRIRPRGIANEVLESSINTTN